MLWWFHLLTACALIAIVPFTKLLHIATAPANQMSAADRTSKGKLAAIDFNDESKELYGLGDVAELDRRARLSLEACTRCGRCQDVCPAFVVGQGADAEAGHPRSAALARRRAADAGRPAAPRSGDGAAAESRASHGVASGPSSIEHDVIWACTTCGACAQVCPVYIEHAPLLVELRQYLVMMEGAIPSEGQLALRNIETNYNPWGIGWADRAAWSAAAAGGGRDQGGAVRGDIRRRGVMNETWLLLGRLRSAPSISATSRSRGPSPPCWIRRASRS